MEDSITLEDMVTQLNGATEEEPEEESQDVVDNPEEETPAAEEEEEPEEDPEPPIQDDKAQQAFIHMRQQNKKYADMLKGVAGVLGLEGDVSDEQALLTALQTKVAEKEAEKNNIPVELYQRLRLLEERDQEFTALQRQQAVAAGFETVKKQFNLTQEELNAFAETLVQNGKNPLSTDLNLVNEYKVINYDRLVQKAADEAVAAEQARAAKAGNNSTTPSDKNGKPPETGDQKVNSVRDLENFFRSKLT